MNEFAIIKCDLKELYKNDIENILKFWHICQKDNSFMGDWLYKYGISYKDINDLWECYETTGEVCVDPYNVGYKYKYENEKQILVDTEFSKKFRELYKVVPDVIANYLYCNECLEHEMIEEFYEKYISKNENEN